MTLKFIFRLDDIHPRMNRNNFDRKLIYCLNIFHQSM